MANETPNGDPIRTVLITLAVLLVTVAAHPVAQQSEPTFEVASIKQNKTESNRVSMNVLPGGRFVATNVSLETLIAGAYGTDAIPLPPNRVVLPPSWAGNGSYATAPRFDIEANPARELRQGELLAAVRRLLEDRFKLAVHHEMREQPSYTLVIDRTDGRIGPRLKRSDIDCTDPAEIRAKDPDGTLKCGIHGRAGSATGRHTMSVLARFLTNVVPDHRTVVDGTNLAGTYEFQIDWAPEVPVPSDPTTAAPADPNATLIFTAVREQLGLRLDSGKQRVDVLVVDHVERPSEN
jgi:uncharacterized protein (TIGR03435 family)